LWLARRKPVPVTETRRDVHGVPAAADAIPLRDMKAS
jgi:hypothetical protein